MAGSAQVRDLRMERVHIKLVPFDLRRLDRYAMTLAANDPVFWFQRCMPELKAIFLDLDTGQLPTK